LLERRRKREQGDDLHLLSVISPEWVKPGEMISVKRAPTNFGQVNFILRFAEGSAVLDLENQYVSKPKQMILHLPWFMQTTNVVADSKPVTITGNSVALPVDTRQIRITWTKRPDAPELNYSDAVNGYKAEYRRRYDEWQHTGQPRK